MAAYSGAELFANGSDNEYLTGTGINKKSADYTVILDTANNTDDPDYTITMADDHAIYYVDEDGEITVSKYSAIAMDDNDKVYAFVDEYAVELLFIEEVPAGVKKSDDETKYYALGLAGTGAGGKNVQILVFEADKDGYYDSTKGLSKADLKKLGITDENVTVTTAGDERSLAYGADETGSYYVGSTKKTWNFKDSGIAYFDGSQYDSGTAFTAAHGSTAGFIKLHLDNETFEGELTVNITGIDGMKFFGVKEDIAAS